MHPRVELKLFHASLPLAYRRGHLSCPLRRDVANMGASLTIWGPEDAPNWLQAGPCNSFRDHFEVEIMVR